MELIQSWDDQNQQAKHFHWDITCPNWTTGTTCTNKTTKNNQYIFSKLVNDGERTEWSMIVKNWNKPPLKKEVIFSFVGLLEYEWG